MLEDQLFDTEVPPPSEYEMLLNSALDYWEYPESEPRKKIKQKENQLIQLKNLFNIEYNTFFDFVQRVEERGIFPIFEKEIIAPHFFQYNDPLLRKNIEHGAFKRLITFDPKMFDFFIDTFEKIFIQKIPNNNMSLEESKLEYIEMIKMSFYDISLYLFSDEKIREEFDNYNRCNLQYKEHLKIFIWSLLQSFIKKNKIYKAVSFIRRTNKGIDLSIYLQYEKEKRIFYSITDFVKQNQDTTPYKEIHTLFTVILQSIKLHCGENDLKDYFVVIRNKISYSKMFSKSFEVIRYNEKTPLNTIYDVKDYSMFKKIVHDYTFIDEDW